MKHRKLRIAWTAWWGVLAVLLCVLWVRSYWCDMRLGRIDAELRLQWIGTEPGTLYACSEDASHTELNPTDGWIFESDTDISDGSPRWSLCWTPSLKHFGVPAWFGTSFFATIAAIPWIRWPKRFSLRTLLIATTLVAVVLGLIVWAVKP